MKLAKVPAGSLGTQVRGRGPNSQDTGGQDGGQSPQNGQPEVKTQTGQREPLLLPGSRGRDNCQRGIKRYRMEATNSSHLSQGRLQGAAEIPVHGELSFPPHPREESRAVEGRVLFYCFGQGNTSLFAEKDLGETQKEQKKGDIGGGRGVPTGGADLGAEEGRLAVPAKTEGAGKVRPPYS